MLTTGCRVSGVGRRLWPFLDCIDNCVVANETSLEHQASWKFPVVLIGSTQVDFFGSKNVWMETLLPCGTNNRGPPRNDGDFKHEWRLGRDHCVALGVRGLRFYHPGLPYCSSLQTLHFSPPMFLMLIFFGSLGFS